MGIASLCLATTSCENELSNDLDLGRVVTIGATMEGDNATRSTASDGGAFAWANGDAISVYNGSKFTTFTLSDGAGTENAKFTSGLLIGEPTFSEYAIYPSSGEHEYDGTDLTVNLPSEYGDSETEYSPNTNALMVAVFSDINKGLTFRHAAGVVRFTVKNVPAGTNKIVLSTKAKITGDFPVSFADGYPSIQTAKSETEESVSIVFSALTAVKETMDFFIPLPQGQYTFTLAVHNESGRKDEITASVLQTISRCTLLKMPAVSFASAGGNIEGGTVTAETSDAAQEVLDDLTGEDPKLNITAGAGVDELTLPESYTEGGTTESQLVVNYNEAPQSITLSESEATASGEASESKGDVKISAPEGTIQDVNIATPSLTATIEAKEGKTLTINELTAITATNTLIIGEGVTINKLNIKGGNVVVKGKVETWKNVSENSATGYIAVAEGGLVPEEFPTGYVAAAELNGSAYGTIEDALKNAVAGDVINLAKGEYTLSGNLALKGGAKGSITLAGKGEKTIVTGSSNANGLDIIMQNLKWTSPNTGYDTAFTHAGSVRFVNCHIIGQYYAQSLATHTFTSCTIDPQTGYLYTYGANCTFENCTFNSSEGKALQVYGEGYDVTSTVTITNCTFTAAKIANTWDGKPVTAIDINSINGNKFIVNITNSTATGYGTGIFSKNDFWNIKGGAENITITIDGEYHVASTTMLENALAKGASTINLTEGTYDIPANAQGKTLTLTGIGNHDAIVLNGNSGNLNSSTITFNNLTIKGTSTSHTGFTHIASATYNGCHLTQTHTLYGPSHFNNCVFTVDNKDLYNVWTYGTSPVFTGCQFNCAGKSILIYNEGAMTCDVTFDTCTFNASQTVDGKAAIQMHTEAGINGKLTINKTTANRFDSSINDGLWNEVNNSTKEVTDFFDIYVDGTQVH